jgi:hypothetical protein
MVGLHRSTQTDPTTAFGAILPLARTSAAGRQPLETGPSADAAGTSLYAPSSGIRE